MTFPDKSRDNRGLNSRPRESVARTIDP